MRQYLKPIALCLLLTMLLLNGCGKQPSEGTDPGVTQPTSQTTQPQTDAAGDLEEGELPALPIPEPSEPVTEPTAVSTAPTEPEPTEATKPPVTTQATKPPVTTEPTQPPVTSQPVEAPEPTQPTLPPETTAPPETTQPTEPTEPPRLDEDELPPIPVF